MSSVARPRTPPDRSYVSRVGPVRRAGRRRLEGRVAVITGASSGVGRAIARTFAREGARVALLARNEDGLCAAADEIRALGAEPLVLVADVADAELVSAAADAVALEWGAIDIWVNNAMVSVFATVEDTTADEYRRVIEVNYLGYVHGTLAALRHMRERDRGVIVQIGSALAYRSIPLQSAYCASKAAIRGFTDSLRSELIHERSSVRLTMLQLPAVNTPQFEVVRNKLGGHPQPVPPIYQPEVVSAAVLRAVLRQRREWWIGWSTARAIVGTRLFPGWLDKLAASRAWEGQTTRQLPPGHPFTHSADNVDEPLAGDRGAHGPFDARARSWSFQQWIDRHKAWIAMAGLAITAGFVIRHVQ